MENTTEEIAKVTVLPVTAPILGFVPEESDEKTTGLVPYKEVQAARIFRSDEGKQVIDAIVSKIKEDMAVRVDSIATPKSRAEMTAYKTKIVKSRTYLETIGKGEADSYNKTLKGINSLRNHAKAELKKLEDEFIKPLEDWKNADKERIGKFTAMTREIEDHGKFVDVNGILKPLTTLKVSLNYLEKMEIDITWGEFMADAQGKQAIAMMALTAQIGQLEEAEVLRKKNEEAEVIRLEQERKDNEGRIAKEAAEKATADAEQKAREDKAIEKERAEKALLDERRAKEEAERKVKQAEEDAKNKVLQAQEDAKRAEKEAAQRVLDAENKAKQATAKAQADLAAKQKAQVDADNARAADVQHRGKINREILAALVECGLEEAHAKDIIKVMVVGKIPHVKVVY